MKVIFNIKYDTVWGQRLFIVGSCTELGADIKAAKEMHYSGEGLWRLEVSLPDSTKEVKYKYFIKDESGICAFENSIRVSENCMRVPENGIVAYHHAIFDKNYDSYSVYDYWQSEPADKTFCTSAFTKNLFAKRRKVSSNAGNSKSKGNLVLRLVAPQIKPEQAIAITGNQQCLGNWDPDNAPYMTTENIALSQDISKPPTCSTPSAPTNDVPYWEIQLNTSEISFPLEYKFVVKYKTTIQRFNHHWEEGANRVINQTQEKDDSCIIIDNQPLKIPDIKWKACGAVIPVFSLRSEDSFGIGDIGDIKTFIDWAKKTGQHIIQVLPMNDTTRLHTWRDSYPYSAISIYALHPLYINIPMLGLLNDRKRIAFYKRIQKKLNTKKTVDYQSVEEYKTAYYREYFDQKKENILKCDGFKEFIAQNRSWLIPYAAFSYLRDQNNTADFSQWGEHAQYNREKIEKFCNPKSEAFNEFSYIFFIQYILHKQFESVSEYARKNEVVLKGDIPIGINRESVEAWTEPDYFNMKGQTGAPPDDFSDTGQNWSFPTYNWDVMEKDGFEWWKKRFRKMNNYFDSFRIDHILGFFRIWEIPREYTEGLCGHFRPALPLSEEEISKYGLTFDNRWTTPRININFIPEIFGDIANKEISKYLNHIDAEHLALNEIFSTQRKINRLFNDCKDKKTQKIKEGLMNIANEVLFLKDPYSTDCYHPRISAYKSYAYRELSDKDKQAFDNLYHDFYFLRHNDFWKETALKRLTPLINNTNMLVCGEDLGMIPASVHEVMDKLQIFTLELERMPKTYGCEFTDLTKLPYHSVCTPSTHDMNPIRAWWKEDRNKTQRYYNNVLHRDGDAPEECSAEMAEQIISNHLHASSMLTLIPLQDWFAIDDKIKHPDAGAERINIPANPNNYWCYRMHITLEKLLNSGNLNRKIKSMVTESGR